MTYAETMEGFRSIYYDLTLVTAKGQLEAILALAPLDHLMMGFDYPMVSETGIDPAVGVLSSELFSAEQLRMIARENAVRLLPRLATRA